MTLTQKNLKARFQVAGEKSKAALKKALAVVLVASPMSLASCNDCPVDSSCSTNDFDITLKEGETKETVTNGEVVAIKVLSISQQTEDIGLPTCEVYGGSATINLKVESETPFEQEIVISPSMCFSITNRCIAISDVSFDSEVGGPDGGTDAEPCELTEKTVSFTLTLGV
ncbi:MAG: hypothetical protein V1861_06145 [Candidatus Micrarchaeota archaeon]